MKRSINQERKIRWLWGVVIIFSLFLLGNNIVLLKKLFLTIQKERVVKKEKEALQAQNRYLKSRLEFVKSQEFVEIEAREKLGLGRKGDLVYIIPTPPVSLSKKPISAPPLPNWKRWWQLFWY